MSAVQSSARASTVCSEMKRTMRTGRVWPKRCTRASACCSTATSTLGSSRNTTLAAAQQPVHMSETAKAVSFTTCVAVQRVQQECL